MTIKTVSFSFSPVCDAAKNQDLFTVTPCVPLIDALNAASDLLSQAIEPAFDAGMDEPLKGDNAWRVFNTIQAAKAVIDSLWAAAKEQE